jgi:hypothetical protein
MYEKSYIETAELLVSMVLVFEIGEEMSYPISINDYSWIFRQKKKQRVNAES